MAETKLRDRVLGRGERRDPRGPLPEIDTAGAEVATEVDAYWNEHTVNSGTFATAEESEAYLGWRFEQYPLFREFSRLWSGHEDEVVLDYGCGPGNDLVGFALRSEARQIIGIDVSRKALKLAADRLALHHVDPERVRLIQTSDSDMHVPLPDQSVDFLQSQGVLMITSDPQGLVGELFRVLKPGGEACFMIYNRDSVWYHLCTAYMRRIVEGRFAGLTMDEAFSRDTDGEDCPISRAYSGVEFSAMCRRAGFECSYAGGYLSVHELNMMDEYWARAITDGRLEEEHRTFLRALTYDRNGYPMLGPYHAGIGGTYWLKKP